MQRELVAAAAVTASSALIPLGVATASQATGAALAALAPSIGAQATRTSFLRLIAECRFDELDEPSRVQHPLWVHTCTADVPGALSGAGLTSGLIAAVALGSHAVATRLGAPSRFVRVSGVVSCASVAYFASNAVGAGLTGTCVWASTIGVGASVGAAGLAATAVMSLKFPVGAPSSQHLVVPPPTFHDAAWSPFYEMTNHPNRVLHRAAFFVEVGASLLVSVFAAVGRVSCRGAAVAAVIVQAAALLYVVYVRPYRQRSEGWFVALSGTAQLVAAAAGAAVVFGHASALSVVSIAALVQTVMLYVSFVVAVVWQALLLYRRWRARGGQPLAAASPRSPIDEPLGHVPLLELHTSSPGGVSRLRSSSDHESVGDTRSIGRRSSSGAASDSDDRGRPASAPWEVRNPLLATTTPRAVVPADT